MTKTTQHYIEVADMALYIILLIVANIIWAGSYSVMKWGMADIHPLSLVFYRMSIATVFLWGIILFFYRDRLKEINRSVAVRLLFVTVLNLLHHIGLCVGVSLSQAADAALIISMEPVVLFFLATIVLKEKINIKHMIAVFTAIAGFIIISRLWTFNFGATSSLAVIGDIIIFFAVISEAGFSTFFKPLADKHSPIVLMAVVTLIQAVTMFPICFFVDKNFMILEITSKSVVTISYLALLCTVFGYVIWLFIMSKISVGTMAISLFLQPVFGPLIAYATLGEPLDPRIFAGGSLIIVSLYVAVMGKRGENPPSPPL